MAVLTHRVQTAGHALGMTELAAWAQSAPLDRGAGNGLASLAGDGRDELRVRKDVRFVEGGEWVGFVLPTHELGDRDGVGQGRESAHLPGSAAESRAIEKVRGALPIPLGFGEWGGSFGSRGEWGPRL
jgi:hypothetical protein